MRRLVACSAFGVGHRSKQMLATPWLLPRLDRGQGMRSAREASRTVQANVPRTSAILSEATPEDLCIIDGFGLAIRWSGHKTPSVLVNSAIDEIGKTAERSETVIQNTRQATNTRKIKNKKLRVRVELFKLMSVTYGRSATTVMACSRSAVSKNRRSYIA